MVRIGARVAAYNALAGRQWRAGHGNGIALAVRTEVRASPRHPSSRTTRARTLCCAFAIAAALGACSDPSRHPHAEGDATRGRLLLMQYGCGACHAIPGVPNARGTIGPPLDRLGRRVYLAGVLANSPQQLALWIRAPQAIKPATGMPNVHATEQDATDMAAYLYRLR